MASVEAAEGFLLEANTLLNQKIGTLTIDHLQTLLNAFIAPPPGLLHDTSADIGAVELTTSDGTTTDVAALVRHDRLNRGRYRREVV